MQDYKDISLKFGKISILKEEINRINKLQNQLKQSQKALQLEIKTIPFQKFSTQAVTGVLNTAISGTRGALQVFSGVAYVGKFIVADAVKVPILSQFAEASVEFLSENLKESSHSIRHLNPTDGIEKLNNRIKTLNEQSDLLTLQSNQCTALIKIAQHCINNGDLITLFSSEKREVSCQEMLKNSCQNLKLSFTTRNISLIEQEISQLDRAKETVINIKAHLDGILLTFKKEITVDTNNDVLIDIKKIKCSIPLFAWLNGEYLSGLKFNKKELFLISYSKKAQSSIEGLAKDGQNISKRLNSLISQLNVIAVFGRVLTTNPEILNKYNYNHGGKTNYQVANTKLAQLAQSLKEKPIGTNSTVLKQELQNLQNIQNELVIIKQEIEEVIEILSNCLSKGINTSIILESLLSIFGRSLTGLEIDSNNNLYLYNQNTKEALKDVINKYRNLLKDIEEKIQLSHQLIHTYIKKIEDLRFKKRLAGFFALSSLVAVFYIGFKNKITQPNTNQISHPNSNSTPLNNTNKLVPVLPPDNSNESKEKINIEYKLSSQPITNVKQPSIVTNQVNKEELLQSAPESVPTTASTPETSVSTIEEDKGLVDLEKAKLLAMEAALMIQIPPYPLEVWLEVKGKWEETIKTLEGISESSSAYIEAREKLAVYKTNYQAINQRILIEKKASSNLQAAQKLAWEAAVMVKNPPHPKEVWVNAQSKLQKAISLLKIIPKGTYAEETAQEKLANYQANYDVISQRIKSQQK